MKLNLNSKSTSSTLKMQIRIIAETKTEKVKVTFKSNKHPEIIRDLNLTLQWTTRGLLVHTNSYQNMTFSRNGTNTGGL
jgi:hypothetical protein